MGVWVDPSNSTAFLSELSVQRIKHNIMFPRGCNVTMSLPVNNRWELMPLKQTHPTSSLLDTGMRPACLLLSWLLLCRLSFYRKTKTEGEENDEGKCQEVIKGIKDCISNGMIFRCFRNFFLMLLLFRIAYIHLKLFVIPTLLLQTKLTLFI